jgi:Flp pilus assembly pilin Flp
MRGNGGRPRLLLRDERGITLVEFALVTPVLLLMMMGFFDLTHRAYALTVLQGAIEEAGRNSTLQTGAVNTASIDAEIADVVGDIVGTGAVFHPAERLSYQNFADVGTPERFVDNPPANNRYDAGECFEDVNANGTWDADRGRTGPGSAQDVVLYRVRITYPRLFPMAGLLGWSPQQEISGTTILRNQPYAPQTIPPVTLCP